MKNRKSISLLLLGAMLLGAVSCGGEAENPETTTAESSSATASEDSEYVYPYPDEVGDGEEFSILNMEDLFTMHCQILREDVTGEVLNDALFNRNKLIESKFGITLKETLVTDTWELKAVVAEARKSILANDGSYDLMLVPIGNSLGLFSEGAFYDLTTIDTVQLDKPWWNQSYNNAISINGKLFSAIGDAHLCIQDAVRILAFNSDMMNELKLELPYDIVREGKWTTDKMNEYLIVAANLNGDDSSAWLKEGKTVYGLTSNQKNIRAYMNAFGETIVEVDNGELVYTAGRERFYDCISKLKNIFTVDDAKVIPAMNGNDSVSDDGNPGYLYVFTSQRALFSYAEVNKLQGFRMLDFEYGIVPLPKYDENQENYISNTWNGVPAACIPTTAADPEMVGLMSMRWHTRATRQSYRHSETIP